MDAERVAQVMEAPLDVEHVVPGEALRLTLELNGLPLQAAIAGSATALISPISARTVAVRAKITRLARV